MLNSSVASGQNNKEKGVKIDVKDDKAGTT